MKKIVSVLAACGLLAACHHPEVVFSDFDTFHVLSVNSTDVALEDGTLNPEIRMMENPELEDPETKVAVTAVANMASDLLGVINSNTVIHVSGTYTGHDIDDSPITLSGKLLVPKDGPIKNLIIVSHFTIGANYECPSESFPLEGMLAAKGYAVVVADYIGFGVTAHRVHPYMHVESTARSVVDMALAVKPYLKHIGREPESEKVILVGYSQGGSTTMAVMRMIQREYEHELPLQKVYCGGGPYDLAATFDQAMSEGKTGIPCAIPMIVQGVSVGEGLNLDMADFFMPDLLAHYDEWINSKRYTVKQINMLMKADNLKDLMTDTGRDKTSYETSRLYKALMLNSVLDFSPKVPIFMFHSMDDGTVPFVNAQRAEKKLKGFNVDFDFDHYGNHGSGALKFLIKVAKDL